MTVRGRVNFGASAERPEDKGDDGDALELTTRQTQEPKPEVIGQAARELFNQARSAMESAASTGFFHRHRYRHS